MTVPLHDTGEARKKIADYLAVLMSRTGLDLEFQIDVRRGDAPDRTPDRAGAGDGSDAPVVTVELSGRDTPLLLARHGELLHAIEHVAAKILRLEPEDHDRISFDAEGFKAARDRELRRSAEQAISEVRSTGRPYTFAPMTSRERRMLHLILSRSGLATASSGEGPRRCVVLYPEGFEVPSQIAGRFAEGSGPAAASAAERTEAIRSRFRRR